MERPVIMVHMEQLDGTWAEHYVQEEAHVEQLDKVARAQACEVLKLDPEAPEQKQRETADLMYEAKVELALAKEAEPEDPKGEIIEAGGKGGSEPGAPGEDGRVLIVTPDGIKEG